MSSLIHILILLPILGWMFILMSPSKNERLISYFAIAAVSLQLVALAGITWLFWNASVSCSDVRDIVVYQTEGYIFYIDFFVDHVSLTYSWVGAILALLVTFYSKTYMHREEGYQRFFATILFFFTGYQLTVFSGNFETLFVGWEILGISSFLLIAFYRNRYLPVKNAVKVFSIYRMGDVGILIAMWLSHHFWHANVTFHEMQSKELLSEHLSNQSWVGATIALMVLLTAAAKSAQLPFSSWLARAMEGPTPSSAIFYGSLSVHIGIFLLLRTMPFWEMQITIRWVIGLLGLTTALVASGIARVQSSIKSQIAYASIAQIGLIFIEVALGLQWLALIHFAGNAFLRTYQLLTSPSSVTYLIKEQFYHFVPREKTMEDSLPKKFEYAFYLLSLKEFNLDTFMYRYLWNPLKFLGKKLTFLNHGFMVGLFIFSYLIGLGLLTQHSSLSQQILHGMPIVYAFLAVILVLKAFTERHHVWGAWLMVILNHASLALAVSFNESFTWDHIFLYLSGIALAGGLGYWMLRKLAKLNETVDLDQFHGHIKVHPKIALVFLLACLGLTGFPITTTFIGEDLVFSHIHEDQGLLALFTALSFVLDGLAVMRIYARVFLGPHAKSMHEMAYRSS
jgi:NADH:ubiquinone oxidoreductase subunit 5 (subunit L)/multisubunit Na+/H+ antiporter MnhA subunit